MNNSSPLTSVNTRLSPPSTSSSGILTTTTTDNNSNMVNNNNSVNLVSTLVKVTEQFLYTVNQLETSFQPIEQLFQSVLEHYDRLNMVIRVLKIACPPLDHLNNNNVRSILERTAENASTTALNTMNRIKNQYSTPSTTTIKTAVVINDEEIEENGNAVTQEQQQQTIKQERVMNQSTILVEQEDNDKNASLLLTINSNQFIQQFENTCNAFALQNHIDFKDCWESLLKIALPKDKLTWAESCVFNKSLDWSIVKKLYLDSFTTINNNNKSSPVLYPFHNNNNNNNNNQGEKQQKKRKLTQRSHFITHPTPPPNMNEYNDTSERNQIKSRQEKYAEMLLSLEMKDYEFIDEYNAKYARYAQAASIDLNTPHLFKRYVNSLLPNYRDMVQAVLTKMTSQMQTPKTLKEIMKLVKKIVLSQQQSQQFVYSGTATAKTCWKQCNHLNPSWVTTTTTTHHHQYNENGSGSNNNVLKRPAPTITTSTTENRPLKRYSSSCST